MTTTNEMTTIVLEALRKNVQGTDGFDDNDNEWCTVYLNNARGRGVSRRQFNTALASLEKSGLYKTVSEHFGSVLLMRPIYKDTTVGLMADYANPKRVRAFWLHKPASEWMDQVVADEARPVIANRAATWSDVIAAARDIWTEYPTDVEIVFIPPHRTIDPYYITRRWDRVRRRVQA